MSVENSCLNLVPKGTQTVNCINHEVSWFIMVKLLLQIMIVPVFQYFKPMVSFIALLERGYSGHPTMLQYRHKKLVTCHLTVVKGVFSHSVWMDSIWASAQQR